MLNSDYSNPALDDDEAERRFKKFKATDPFPEIKPALLNSADFIDYAVTTGMIFPFNPEVGIKPASYEVKLGSEVLYWDDKNKRQYNKDTIVFRKNSITFVTVAARFRLPDYIALRFNLQIRHVHRGLLLGTGPLVDPGFNGKLMIPIHNLTENDYDVDENEGLICIEFTKLSGWYKWKGNLTTYTRVGIYKDNAGKKNQKTFLDFIKMHVPQGKVRSSLLSTLADMTVKMNVANDTAQAIKATFTKYLSWGSVGVAITMAGVAIAMIAIVISIYNLTADANKYVADAKNTYIEKLNESADGVLLDINKREFSTIRDNLKSMEVLLDSNKKELPDIREELKNLRGQLDAANIKILNLERSIQPSKPSDEGSKDKGG